MCMDVELSEILPWFYLKRGSWNLASNEPWAKGQGGQEWEGERGGCGVA